MVEIQRHIIKRGRRNVVSRLYRTKGDKKAITAWRLDLNGILHTLNVCSITSSRRLLTSRFQTELGIDPHATAPHRGAASKHTTVANGHLDISNAEVIVPNARSADVSNTHLVVSDVRGDVANIRTTVFGIHRDKLKSRGDVDGQNQAVSIAHTLRITE